MFWVEMVSFGLVVTTTLQLGLQRGDIVVFFLPSVPVLILSGDSARLSRGDPGSADLGRPAPNFLPPPAEPGVRLAPGLYV